MTVNTEKDEQVNMKICYTHYGHGHKLQHNRISKIKGQEIALTIKEESVEKVVWTGYDKLLNMVSIAII